MTIKVLLVDDSAIIRGLMTKALSADPEISIVGSAANGAMAIGMVKDCDPDIIILDIEMPVMDGIAALPELLKACPKCKIIMASTLTMRNASISMQALSLGASDYLAKPSSKGGSEVEDFYRELIAKVKALAWSHGRPVSTGPAAVAATPAPVLAPKLIQPLIQMPLVGVKAVAIASSTGGPQALLTVFGQIKNKLQNVPIFITQHMPPTFTTILAEHLAKEGARPCSEAKNGEVVKPGAAYLAAGDYHMIPQKSATGEVSIHINQDPQENYCRPAADPMLRALSGIYGKNLLVVVLTGMGSDGMLGCKVVVEHGGSVIAQDEASCVVYGMPKAVADQNLCRAILPLNEIGNYLIQQIDGR